MMVMMTACGNEDKEAVQKQNPEQTVDNAETDKSQTEEVNAETDKDQTEEVNTETKEAGNPNKNVASDSTVKKADFQSIIPGEWGIKLPSNFPVTKGKYLTAIASSTQNKASFTFYNTDKQLEINDPKIKKTGQLVGQLVITQYENEKAASEEIDQTVFKDGEAVELGHGITGYQDGGAGSLFTSWNEGRWAIIARSTTEKSEESLATAKETVEFLETHMMPIPKKHGHLHIDAKHTGSLAAWQKQNFVYRLTDFGDNTLNWLVTFK
ncbi:hypothetical protein ACQKL5_13970 [Peribacillus sp. NPDC097675]|uniref:hypothetical protein n=1 Tax=Peribacillus sp. NPDC097675 TaxID=3390618 RepID=UPI003D01BA12